MYPVVLTYKSVVSLRHIMTPLNDEKRQYQRWMDGRTKGRGFLEVTFTPFKFELAARHESTPLRRGHTSTLGAPVTPLSA